MEFTADVLGSVAADMFKTCYRFMRGSLHHWDINDVT